MVTESKSYAEDPQILGTSFQNLVAFTTWRPGFVHPWKGGLLHGFVKLQFLLQQLLVECARIFSTADLFVWLLVWNRVVCAIYIFCQNGSDVLNSASELLALWKFFVGFHRLCMM